MTKEIKQLKKEFLPGGSKRQYILDKAVDYLKSPGLQGNKHIFCLDILKMTETEYLEALNKATNGAMVRDLWN
jgi:hypothetical protein|tara:strand:+ start:324 stop:542 length:219 start_codon:yes stop_codon:yes gene_type:complete